ncbi:GyrI-like domain-containing protein [bacterium]|nr:GyrI-like domain-containing protein [bacterium]MBU4602088.1 GyrI-like domain-containing protein [bacterium]
MATKKLDFVKEYKTYYTAKTTPEVVEFGEIPFLTIEGRGEPAGKEFTSKVETLYPFAYGVKNLCKKQGKDFAVPKLEGLWWVESDKPALEVPREEWQWKLLIRMPDFAAPEIVEKAREEVFKKKGIELIKEIKFEKMKEGKCVQILHIGPYSAEPESLEKMRNLMKEKDFIENGLHHEIYLSDPRKVAPEKMKTILKQPVKEQR